MNKYAEQSKALRRQRSKEKMCLNKVRFETEQDAFQKNQRIYQCRYCGAWHRSGQLEQFIKKIIKRNS